MYRNVLKSTAYVSIKATPSLLLSRTEFKIKITDIQKIINY